MWMQGSVVWIRECSSFQTKGCSCPEIRRRIKKAAETFRRLWRVWAMKGLPLKLKGRLYNSKVSTINETAMKALVGRNGYLMRRLVEKLWGVRMTRD